MKQAIPPPEPELPDDLVFLGWDPVLLGPTPESHATPECTAFVGWIVTRKAVLPKPNTHARASICINGYDREVFGNLTRLVRLKTEAAVASIRDLVNSAPTCGCFSGVDGWGIDQTPDVEGVAQDAALPLP